jgi:hypothetical protein
MISSEVCRARTGDECGPVLELQMHVFSDLVAEYQEHQLRRIRASFKFRAKSVTSGSQESV